MALTTQDLASIRLSELQALVKRSLEDHLPPSITVDMWTSKKGLAFLSFTIHLVTNEWKLINDTLGTIPFEGEHTAKNIREALDAILMKSLNMKLGGDSFCPTVTTDCGANVAAAIDDSDNLYWLKCSLHIIPNSNITIVTTLSKEFIKAIVTVSVEYSADTATIIKKLEREMELAYNDMSDKMLEPPTVLGISAFTESAVNIKIICDTVVGERNSTEYALRLRIKEMFDREGIVMPFPQRDVNIKKES